MLCSSEPLPGLHPASASRKWKTGTFLPFHLTYWKPPARLKDTAGCLSSAITHPQHPSVSRGVLTASVTTQLLAASCLPSQIRAGTLPWGFEIPFKTNINFYTAGSDQPDKFRSPGKPTKPTERSPQGFTGRLCLTSSTATSMSGGQSPGAHSSPDSARSASSTSHIPALPQQRTAGGGWPNALSYWCPEPRRAPRQTGTWVLCPCQALRLQRDRSSSNPVLVF